MRQPSKFWTYAVGAAALIAGLALLSQQRRHGEAAIAGEAVFAESAIKSVTTRETTKIALAATVFAITAPRDSSAVGQPVGLVASIEAAQDAAAGITFKIVPADAMSKTVAWTPLTGDGSN